MKGRYMKSNQERGQGCTCDLIVAQLQSLQVGRGPSDSWQAGGHHIVASVHHNQGLCLPKLGGQLA